MPETTGPPFCRVFYTVAEADARLVPGDTVHSFREAPDGTLIGADWPRERVIELMEKYRPEEAGPTATAGGHGVVVVDGFGPVFFETGKGGRDGD